MRGKAAYVLGAVTLAAALALITWLSRPRAPLAPTLPEIGPGARPVSGSARIGPRRDASTPAH
jgi:hypothetical protein